NNRTTVEILVEETCQSSPTPVVNKKRKAKNVFSPGPTVQDSEGEDPNTASNLMELDSEEELTPQKGKERGKSTQGSAISKRQVPEMPLISEPELELKKLIKSSISVETFEENTSSHQNLLLDHVEKSDEARIDLKYEIQSEIRLITEKMDKINEANLNIPKLLTPFSHIRSPVNPKEEITNPLITDLSHQDNNQLLMKEAPQLNEFPTFTSVG
ncbi:hypothetical protein O181_082929, partial [Austropuccinia psidii MF-1]|nr:hypothetical protein [Austropuccinia psidii MF-1]